MMELELNLDYGLLEDKTIFYEWQNAIRDDFKRVLMVLDDYENTKEKNRLVYILNYINETITKNKPIDYDDIVDLKIVLNNSYLIFDICNNYQEIPLIIIFKRDMSEFCFIEEEMWIDPKERGMDDTYYYGLYSFIYFSIDKKEKKVRLENWSKEAYFTNLFNKTFYDTQSIMSKEDKVYTKLKEI